MTNRTFFSRHAVRSQTVLLLAFALVVALFLPRPSLAQSEGGSGLSGEGQRILADVNQARIDNGLPALALSPALTLAAQRHVDDIIANGNWGHYGSDGSNVRLRAARVGYPTGHVSENWVAVASPEKAIVWWMNDWIHRVNILQGHWDEIGVGAAQAGNGYWIFVTDFGNIDGNAMPPVVESAAVTNLTFTDTGGAVEALPENGEYRIQGGDTLLGIAIRYGLDWQDIALANNMGEDELLQIGRVIRLPMLAGTGGPAASAGLEIAAGKQTHAIRPGETLWTIAARYEITWQEVAAVNGLGEYDLLQIGDELKLPASLDEPDEAEEEATDAGGGANNVSQDAERREEGARFIQSAAPAAKATPAPSRFSYTVKAGDTLLAIAINHDLAWETLAEANNLDGDSFLQIGQELAIPGAATTFTQASADAAPEDAPVAADPGRVYRIKRGDTVFGVALQYGLDWQELLRLNGLDEDSLLQPGQELQLP
jgi:LysM repeat protein/uncharacterized protein YkwD